MSKQVSFKFNAEQTKALDNIKTKLNAGTQAEAIRKSLNLTSALASATAEGYKIILKAPDGKGEDQEIMII